MGYYSMKEGGIFETFFKQRSRIINQFETGQINKRQFLDYNHNLVRRTGIQPFLRIDTYEMGMYNYQYYNVLAKYNNMMAKEYREMKKSERQCREFSMKCNNYYNEKDKAIMDILEFLDFKNMEAYYIDLESKSLNNVLYEIVLLDYKEAIFHSKSDWILERLKNEGVFFEDKRESLIDEYINNTY